MLSAELVDEGKSIFVRNAAGLARKNALSARGRCLSDRYFYHIPAIPILHIAYLSGCPETKRDATGGDARSLVLVLARALIIQESYYLAIHASRTFPRPFVHLLRLTIGCAYL